MGGCFIGNDLQYDPQKRCLKASIDNYFDKGGKNGLGKDKAEREKNLLKYVCRCYRVLFCLAGFGGESIVVIRN